MSRIQAASALLLLSLPNGFASPLAEKAFPVFQLLSSESSAASAAPTGSDAPAESSSSVPLGDPTAIGGPQNNSVNPIPNPLIPVLTPVPDDNPSSLVLSPVAPAGNGSLPWNVSVPLYTGISPPPGVANPTALTSTELLLPIETAVPPPVTAPLGPHALALSDFTTLVQEVANAIARFFTILVPIAGPAGNVSVPFPLSNGTSNSTVLERRQVDAVTAAAQALSPDVTITVVQQLINLVFGLLHLANPASVVGDNAPNVADTVAGATSNSPLSGVPVQAVGNGIANLPISAPNLPISRIRRQTLPDVTTATSAESTQKLASLMVPMLNIANSVADKIRTVPGVGGAVPSVSFSDAVSALGRTDLSTIDPAQATGLVRVLLALAGRFVQSLNSPTIATGAAFGSITKRDLGDLDPTLALGIVSNVNDILREMLNQSPASAATQDVPLDTVLGIANSLGKRSLAVDPSDALAVINKIVATIATLTNGIPGVGAAAAALKVPDAANTLPSDPVTNAAAGLPVNSLNSASPVGSLTANLPVGDLASDVPGIVTIPNPLAANSDDMPPNTSPVVGPLTPRLPLIEGLTRNFQKGNSALIGKRDISAVQSEAVMSVAQDLLNMALTMTNEIPLANAHAAMEKRQTPDASSATITQLLQTIRSLVSQLTARIQSVAPAPVAVVPAIPVASPSLAVPISPPNVPVSLPVSLPSVALPSLPVSVPSLPVSVPNLPVSVPSLPVSVPRLPVALPTLPISGLPTALPSLLPPFASIAPPRIPLALSSLPVKSPSALPPVLPGLPKDSSLGALGQFGDLPPLDVDPLTGLPLGKRQLPNLSGLTGGRPLGAVTSLGGGLANVGNAAAPAAGLAGTTAGVGGTLAGVSSAATNGNPVAALGSLGGTLPGTSAVNGLVNSAPAGNSITGLTGGASGANLIGGVPGALGGSAVPGVAGVGGNLLAGASSAATNGNPVAALGSLGGTLAVAPPVNGLVNSLPGGNSVTDLTGRISAANPIGGVPGALGGNSAPGVLGQLQPVSNTATGAVGAAVPVVNGVAPGVAAVASPIISAAQSALAAISPAVAAVSPVASAVGPVISPVAPLLSGASVGTPSAASTPLPAPPGGAGALGPVTGAVGTVPNAVAPLKSVTGQLDTLQASLNLALQQLGSVFGNNALGVVRLAQRDSMTMDEGSVQSFLQKWQSVGTAMAAVHPEAVEDMMDVLMDEDAATASPAPDMADVADVADSAEQVQDFVSDYYAFAQQMNSDAGVTADDKIAFLKTLFEPSSGETAEVGKSKRTMRNGMRASDE
ncbi:hypothetical protein ACEQ8H_005164 [Pleosporales sp. CAS-2024a]